MSFTLPKGVRLTIKISHHNCGNESPLYSLKEEGRKVLVGVREGRGKNICSLGCVAFFMNHFLNYMLFLKLWCHITAKLYFILKVWHREDEVNTGRAYVKRLKVTNSPSSTGSPGERTQRCAQGKASAATELQALGL